MPNLNLTKALASASVLLITVGFSARLLAADAPVTPLPPPHAQGGKPLMEALKARQSIREFSSKPLPPQMLSDLLWAAFGINRPENGHRTAPSAMNAQEIDLYVLTAEGVSQYDATRNALQTMQTVDLRSKTGGQDFVKIAPIALVFVADYARMTRARPADKDFYAAIDAGFISQNVYLFCASEGLATVIHELDRPPLAKALKLRPDQKIIIAQAVGYPK